MDKRLSYINWFKKVEIEDTGRVAGSTITLDFPVSSSEGMPLVGYYAVDVFIVCQEWNASIPPQRVPTTQSQTLEVKGSGDSFVVVDISHSYTQGIGMNVSIYNNSLQGSAIVNVTGEDCSDRKISIRFTGPQTATASVQISGGYITFKYLGKQPGDFCSSS